MTLRYRKIAVRLEKNCNGQHGAWLLFLSPYSPDRNPKEMRIIEVGRAMQARMWSVYAGALQHHLGDKLDDAQAAQLAELLAALSRNS